jgi:RNA recognition motif-containing protein
MAGAADSFAVEKGREYVLPPGKLAAIHVSNIDHAATDSDVEDLFSAYKEHITSFYVSRDRRRHNQCRGSAIVYFQAFGEGLVNALKAVDGHYLRGKKIHVRLADHKNAEEPETAEASKASAPTHALTAKAQPATQTSMDTAPGKSALTAAAPPKAPGSLRLIPRQLTQAKRPRDT